MLVSVAMEKGLLTDKVVCEVAAIMEGAEESGVWLLYETEHHHYYIL